MVGGLKNGYLNKDKIKQATAAAHYEICQVINQHKLTDKEIVPFISNLITVLTIENNKYIQQDYND